jgi:valyl-tRNA synthetase
VNAADYRRLHALQPPFIANTFNLADIRYTTVSPLSQFWAQSAHRPPFLLLALRPDRPTIERNKMCESKTKYSPAEAEAKWYAYWEKHQCFQSHPDHAKDPYTIIIPPPNVTGVLHMGHILNNTIQDILVRRARMKGYDALWVPGTDHASIATEAKVVDKLSKQGISKNDLSRDAFLAHAWDWTTEHGGIILEQLRKLGASCDWSRTSFTMDSIRSESVINVFVELYRQGLIYRGVRMVNWDPCAKTAVSDEEVIYREEHGYLYYLRYLVEKGNDNNYVLVATTRPETILGDVALCVHPDDERYSWLVGNRVLVPLINRSIPVIADECVDISFGTGCLKVTPAHDVTDYMLGEKYHLEVIDLFNDDGTMNGSVNGLYEGMDRFEAREQIILDIHKKELLDTCEHYLHKVGHSERTNAVIEPRLSIQWFVKMDKLVKPALEAVMNDEIHFHPAKFKNTYRHWMENIKDWCISRQLWWGHRIPAWYVEGKAGFIVAETAEEALAEARRTIQPNLQPEDLHQDEDCLDTWFSSWLWPISLFDGIRQPDNEEMRRYYPTSDLVTGPDIIFFWVARMIMAGYHFTGKKPFTNVYFTGIVRDKMGQKMSKSLGNSPDPLALIEKYGADGVRMGMMLAAPAGNDLLFEEALCEQGRNFNNKIWNAFRLVKGWEKEADETVEQTDAQALAIEWFHHRLNRTLCEMEDLFPKYRISEAMMAAYKLFWDEFASWYLEILKPSSSGGVRRLNTAAVVSTMDFFDSLLRILHPFMPFITEELWQSLRPRREGESIMLAPLPEADSADARLLADFDFARSVIVGIRNFRGQHNLSPKEVLDVYAEDTHTQYFSPITERLANVRLHEGKAQGWSASFLVGTTEYTIPMNTTADIDGEREKVIKELAYQEGFLASIRKKLNNESFVHNAPPAVVEAERRKEADTLIRIHTLQSTLESYNTHP